MVLVKITILLWILFFVIRFFVRDFMSNEEKSIAAFTRHIKITPGRTILVTIFLLAIIGSILSVIWVLFLR